MSRWFYNPKRVCFQQSSSELSVWTSEIWCGLICLCQFSPFSYYLFPDFDMIFARPFPFFCMISATPGDFTYYDDTICTFGKTLLICLRSWIRLACFFFFFCRIVSNVVYLLWLGTALALVHPEITRAVKCEEVGVRGWSFLFIHLIGL